MLPDAFTGRAQFLPDEPVGDIDMGLNVLGSGISLQNGAHGHVEVRELRQLLDPSGVAIDIRIGHNLPALQHQQPLVDHGLAAGGQPEEAGHDAGPFDAPFFCFSPYFSPHLYHTEMQPIMKQSLHYFAPDCECEEAVLWFMLCNSPVLGGNEDVGYDDWVI